MREDQLPLACSGILPSVGASFISLCRVGNLLGNGEVAYSIIIIIGRRENNKKQSIEDS